jgi:hypothetical protein
MSVSKKSKKKRTLRFRIPKKSQEQIENIPLKNLIYISLAINILMVLSVLFLKKFLPPVVPLYYGLAKSEAQLAKQTYLIIPSLTSFTVLLVNIFFSIFSDNDYLKKTLIIGAFAVTFLSAITTIKITFLVGSF